jgi:predicted restriction endonuclease
VRAELIPTDGMNQWISVSKQRSGKAFRALSGFVEFKDLKKCLENQFDIQSTETEQTITISSKNFMKLLFISLQREIQEETGLFIDLDEQNITYVDYEDINFKGHILRSYLFRLKLPYTYSEFKEIFWKHVKSIEKSELQTLKLVKYRNGVTL